MKHYQSDQRKGIAQEGEWIDQDLAVKSDIPLVDSASGKKVIIRMFDFEWKKGITKEEKGMVMTIGKQGFFNSHARYIRDFLWKDGLSILENEDPKIMFTKKGYRIAVVCQAKFGVSIFEKGRTLQDMLKSKKK